MSIRPFRDIKRRKTKKIKVGKVEIGGDAPISVQSMTNTLTTDVDATIKQINELTEAGADIVRVSCPDQDSSLALKKILKHVDVPIVADIHFHYKRAIEAANSGANCLRINPGNIGSKEKVQEILKAAKDNNCSIRIGINAGYDITTNCQVTNIGHSARQNATGVTCIAGTCVMGAIFTATSDCRSKCNIKDLPYGLNFINLLRPVSYKWKPQADKLDEDGNLIEEGEKCHSHQRTMFGLLGQQVREATKKLGLGYNDFSGFSDQEYENRNNPDWKKSYTMEDKTIQLTYDDFIAPLIKSVQELSAEVDSLKAQLKTT